MLQRDDNSSWGGRERFQDKFPQRLWGNNSLNDESSGDHEAEVHHLLRYFSVNKPLSVAESLQLVSDATLRQNKLVWQSLWIKLYDIAAVM